jgi:hypothetical protein
MKPNRLIAPAAMAGIVAARRGVPHRPDPTELRAILAVAVVALGVIIAPRALAGTGCGPGEPPPEAASKDVSDVYGQPATLWLTNTIVGITTAQGYGEAAIGSASPIERRALLIDAQQDGNHQIIVDAGREALLYTLSGCTITPLSTRTARGSGSTGRAQPLHQRRAAGRRRPGRCRPSRPHIGFRRRHRGRDAELVLRLPD